MADFSEDNYRDFYEIYRPDILQCLDPDRQFMFSYLRSKFILDDEDCERVINGCTTRQQKVSKFLSIMACKGLDALRNFVDALEFEYPLLYEKITGKKAVSRHSPVQDYTAGETWNWITGLAGKELVDFDRQFLAKQLERVIEDLQNMAYNYHKVLEEKNVLERKLFEVTSEFELQQTYFHNVQEEVMQTQCERRAVETDADALQTDQPLQFYLQELWQENMEKGNFIIALQGKLLAANEEVENSNKTIEQMGQKSLQFKEQVKELTIDYDSERRNSKKLNERVMTQTCEIKKMDNLKKDVLDLRYRCGIAEEERDNYHKELEEFRKWTEVLSARYDIVTQEREELRENSEDISGRIYSVQDRLKYLEAELLESDYRCEVSNREIERVKGIIAAHKQQRKQLLSERETAINERTLAIKERDLVQNLNKELQSTRDSAVNNHMALCHELEEKYDNAVGELKTVVDKLRETECELMNVKKSLKKLERTESIESPSSSNVKEQMTKDTMQRPKNDLGKKHFDDSDAMPSPDQVLGDPDAMPSPDRGLDKEITTSPPPRVLTRRSHQELIDSIRRKIHEDSKSPSSRKAHSLPANASYALKGLLGYEQMHLIYPHAIRGTIPKISSPTNINPNVREATSPSAMSSNILNLKSKRHKKKTKSYVNVEEVSNVQGRNPFEFRISPFSSLPGFSLMSNSSNDDFRQNSTSNNTDNNTQDSPGCQAIESGYPFVNQTTNTVGTDAPDVSNPMAPRPVTTKGKNVVKGNELQSGSEIEKCSELKSTGPFRQRVNCMDTCDASISDSEHDIHNDKPSQEDKINGL